MSSTYVIGRDEWPSRDPEYPEEIILRRLTNKEYMSLLTCTSIQLETLLYDLLKNQKMMTNFDVDKIRLADKFFLYNKIKESSSLSNIIKIHEDVCSEGHTNHNIEINIVKDVPVLKRPDNIPLIYSLETENCGVLNIEMLKFKTADIFLKELKAALPAEYQAEIDEEVAVIAAHVIGPDPTTVYNLFSGELLGNSTDIVLTQEEIFKIYSYVNKTCNIGLGDITKECSNPRCQGSLTYTPIDVYSQFVQFGEI